MLKTQVKLAEQHSIKTVSICKDKAIQITEEIKQNWQAYLNTLTDFLEVKSGLIMQITPTSMKVFVANTNKDTPYVAGDEESLCHGLYCETVIGTNKELHVENALTHALWKDNPDIKLNMIAYYGLPILFSKEQSVFGTLCLLDDKPMPLSTTQKDIVRVFRDSIEKDLLCI